MEEEKTVFDWSEEDITVKSPKGNSKLSKPGGDCNALYQRADNKNLYLRLELYDPIDVDIQYIFLVNTAEKVVYHILCVPGRVNFFEYKNGKAKELNKNPVKAYLELGKHNVEIALDYTALGLKEAIMSKAVTQVIVEELGPAKVVKSDKDQFE